jgi:hypothetical protein
MTPRFVLGQDCRSALTMPDPGPFDHGPKTQTEALPPATARCGRIPTLMRSRLRRPAFDAVVINDQNDGSGCQKVTCAQRAVPDFVLDLMQRLRHKAELSKIVSTLTERDLRGLNARVVAYPLRLAGGGRRKARRLFHFRGSPGTFPVEAALGDGAQTWFE